MRGREGEAERERERRVRDGGLDDGGRERRWEGRSVDAGEQQ